MLPLTTLRALPLKETHCAVRRGEPVTAGVPFPEGRVHDPSTLAVMDESGRPMPLQARVLDAWPDGSIRWALVDVRVSTGPDGLAVCPLGTEAKAEADTDLCLEICESPQSVDVNTGAVRLVTPTSGSFSLWALPGAAGGGATAATLRAVDDEGRSRDVEVSSVVVEQPGPLRAVLRIEGSVPALDAGRDLDVIARLHCFAGAAVVRFELTVLNRHPASHPGGIWTLGAGGSIRFREFALRLAFPPGEAAVRLLCSAEAGRGLEPFEAPLTLYQESSGGQNWRSHNHANRHGVVPMSLRGYRLTSDSRTSRGLRASPIVVSDRAGGRVAVTVRDFWQNFPKAIAADLHSITVSLFPSAFPDLHELQGGEQKTHEIAIAFAADQVSDLPLEWCRAPLLLQVAPEWYSATGAVPYLLPARDDTNLDYLDLVNEAVSGDDGFVAKREVIDEYGWRNFGDLYADHEAAHHAGGEPLVSHYNNQYDAIAAFAHHFMRTGDTRWWQLMDDLARHVVDIDMYHTDGDKAAFNGGLFWHTYHYVDVGGATHRSYPAAPGVNGGGPANEHNYTTGLMLHHFLTGRQASREAVLGLATWAVNMDDGGNTPFRWLARGRTGLASVTADALFHGPGRGAGNSVNALLDAHRLTGARHFLAKAEELILRCVHPADAIDTLHLLDPERRWSYTVFLRALGKYLEHKAELGQADSLYAHVRAGLLHYVRWMADHERPYLEKPEILEYPDESWAALDLKKSEAFMLASRHVEDPERERFLERAAFFFRHATSELLRLPNRTKARPKVLTLSHGWMWAWFQRNPVARLPVPDQDYAPLPVPATFIPQKARAVRRATVLALWAAAAGLASAAAIVAALVWR